jgi:hypothetical protein
MMLIPFLIKNEEGPQQVLHFESYSIARKLNKSTFIMLELDRSTSSGETRETRAPLSRRETLSFFQVKDVSIEREK